MHSPGSAMRMTMDSIRNTAAHFILKKEKKKESSSGIDIDHSQHIYRIIVIHLL